MQFEDIDFSLLVKQLVFILYFFENAFNDFERLRTFARKSSHNEICFISRLKLSHKLPIPKKKKKKKKCELNHFVTEKKTREKSIISIDHKMGRHNEM